MLKLHTLGRGIHLSLGFMLWLLVIVSTTSKAQPGTWKSTPLCSSCSPEGFIVGDSLNMIVMTNQAGRIISHFTADGGMSWDTSSFPSKDFVTVDYSYASFLPPSSYYLFSRPSVYYTTDRKSWKRGAVIDATKTGKMFTPLFGYWLVGGVQGVTELRRTDFGPETGSFTERVSEWDRSPFAESNELIDSLHILRTSVRELYRSKDRGQTWDTIRPLSTTTAGFSYAHLTRDINRFYVIGGKDTLGDYIYTADGGETWKEVSGVTDRRILRLVEQDTNKIWLAVARRQKSYPSPNLLSKNLSTGQFADTLYYSSDGGNNWQKDITFAGDTIFEMKWPTSSHGYLVSFQDSIVKLSRWMPSNNRVSARDGWFARSQLYIHPNPAKHVLKFYAPLDGSCSIRLFDLLGREMYSEQFDATSLTENVIRLNPTLPEGFYLLQLQYLDGFATESFILTR
jgi:hypothetical protein